MKINPYPKIEYRPLNHDEKILIERIKRRVFLDSDEKIMTYIRQHFNIKN